MKFTLEVDTKKLKVKALSGVTSAVTDPDVLDKIARQHSIGTIFIAVAANKNTREDTFNFMIDYMRNKSNKCNGKQDIYKRIAQNPNATKAILDKVIEFGYPTSAKLAEQHPNYKKK